MSNIYSPSINISSREPSRVSRQARERPSVRGVNAIATMISISSLLLPLMLFSELSGRLATVASPATKAGERLTQRDALGSLLDGDAMSAPAVVPGFLLDGVGDEDGDPRVIVSDASLKGPSVRGLISAFARGHGLSHTPAQYGSREPRRDVDLDILRCMIGRVYRPCWES